MVEETQWIFTSDRVDLAKLSSETQIKLVTFADVAPTYHLSKRIVWSYLGGGPVFTVLYPTELVKGYLEAWAELKTIPEEQVSFFVDNANSTAKIDLFQKHCAEQNREPHDYEFTRIWDEAQNFERELIVLGERIMRRN